MRNQIKQEYQYGTKSVISPFTAVKYKSVRKLAGDLEVV
jgi:hypothetical protein